MIILELRFKRKSNLGVIYGRSKTRLIAYLLLFTSPLSLAHHTATKLIGSGAAFEACDRLEKISVAEGRYISKWVSNIFRLNMRI